MEEKIERLKELGKLHKIALTYDYVPSSEEIEEVWDHLSEEIDIILSKDELERLLETYSGSGTYDIESEVFDLIDKL